MCGYVNTQDILFSYMSPRARVPATHPVWDIKRGADHVLQDLSPTFAGEMYNAVSRPSIPPEQLLKREFLIALIITPIPAGV